MHTLHRDRLQLERAQHVLLFEFHRDREPTSEVLRRHVRLGVGQGRQRYLRPRRRGAPRYVEPIVLLGHDRVAALPEEGLEVAG